MDLWCEFNETFGWIFEIKYHFTDSFKALRLLILSSWYAIQKLYIELIFFKWIIAIWTFFAITVPTLKCKCCKEYPIFLKLKSKCLFFNNLKKKYKINCHFIYIPCCIESARTIVIIAKNPNRFILFLFSFSCSSDMRFFLNYSQVSFDQFKKNKMSTN